MVTYNLIMCVYLTALIVTAWLLGGRFLALPYGQRLTVGIGSFLPLVVWAVIHYAGAL